MRILEILLVRDLHDLQQTHLEKKNQPLQFSHSHGSVENGYV